jgi:hypothetical protein
LPHLFDELADAALEPKAVAITGKAQTNPTNTTDSAVLPDSMHDTPMRDGRQPFHSLVSDQSHYSIGEYDANSPVFPSTVELNCAPELPAMQLLDEPRLQVAVSAKVTAENEGLFELSVNTWPCHQ